MPSEQELIAQFGLEEAPADEQALIDQFGLEPADDPEPMTGPVGPSGGKLRENRLEGTRYLAREQAKAQQEIAVEQALMDRAQAQDPQKMSLGQIKEQFKTLRDSQGGLLTKEQEALERIVLQQKQEEVNAPAKEAELEAKAAEPFARAVSKISQLDSIAGDSKLTRGPLGVASGMAAGAVSGGLGILESVFRTPEAVARGFSALNTIAKKSDNKALDMLIPDTIKREVDSGFATAGIADQIAIARKALPYMSGVFAKNEILGQQAEKATDEALKYAFTLGKEGDPHQLFEVITNPHAWGGFIGNAAPSLFAAYKSRGSLGFLAWLEGMEVANDAADFEKETGIKVDDAEFTQGVVQAGVINSFFERIVPGRLHGMKAGSRNLFKASLVGGKEALGEMGTESIQALNTNLAKKLSYNDKQKLSEGVLSSAMGGFGTGQVAGTVTALMTPEGMRVLPGKLVRETQDGKLATAAAGTSEGSISTPVSSMENKSTSDALTGLNVSPESTRQNGAEADPEEGSRNAKMFSSNRQNLIDSFPMSEPTENDLTTFYEKVQENLPIINKRLDTVSDAIGADGWVYRVKRVSSLMKKLARKNMDPDKPKRGVGSINDMIGSSIFVPPGTLADAMQKIEMEFPDLVATTNFRENPTFLGYNGVHYDVLLPNGMKAELQLFEGQDELARKFEAHKIYEDWREYIENNSGDQANLDQVMQRIQDSGKDVKKFQADMEKSIKIYKKEVEIPLSNYADVQKSIYNAGREFESLGAYEIAKRPNEVYRGSLGLATAEDEIMPGASPTSYNAQEVDALKKVGIIPAHVTGVAKTALKTIMETGGVTIQPVTNLQVKPGEKVFGYSTDPANEVKIDKDKITADDIKNYVKQRAEKWGDTKIYLGGWVDGGIIYLDVSRVSSDIFEAISGAKEKGQLAIFDFSTGQSLKIQTDEQIAEALKQHGKSTEEYQNYLRSRPGDSDGRGLSEDGGSTERGQRTSALTGLGGKVREFVRGRDKTVTLKESQALKGQLRAEARAAKYGYRAGVSETRDKLLQEFRQKETEHKEIRQQIFEFVRENLPPAARSKFLSVVRDAKTKLDLAKALFKISDEVDRQQRSALVSTIKKRLGQVKDSENIAVEFKSRVNAVIDGIDLTKRQEVTIGRLKLIQDYIARQKAAGKDVTLPQHVMDALQILRRKPIENVTIPELENIVDRIDALIQLGETKLRARENLVQYEKDRILAEITANAGTNRIEKIAENLPPPGSGQDPTLLQKIRNFFTNKLNFASLMDLSITPMDAVFDHMDGDQNYQGPIFKNFKKREDANYSRFLDENIDSQEAIWKLAEELNLTNKNFERVGIYAAMVQEGGPDKLANLGISEADAAAVKLTENEAKFYEFMRAKLDELRPRIEKMMRETYNKPLGNVKNYFSFMTDFKAMSEAEVFQRFGDNVQKLGAKGKKNPELGFTKERVGAGDHKIKVNAMEVYLRHMENALYALNVGPDNKLLFEVANRPEFKELVGDRGQAIVLEWLDLMSRKGGSDRDTRIELFDAVRHRVGAAVLGLKLSSILIQPTALFDGAALIGNYAFRGVQNVAFSKNWRVFLKENFPELRGRIADDPAFTEFSDNKTLAEIQKKGFWALQQMDALTASAIVAGAYQQYLDQSGKVLDFDAADPAGVAEAQRILRRTQASPMFKDLPMAISRGKLSEQTRSRSTARLLFQFQTFMLNRWSLIRHDLVRNGIYNADFRKAGNIAAFLMIANLAEMGIRHLSKELIALMTQDPDIEDERDEAVEKFWQNLAINLSGNIPFVSQAVSMVTYGGIPVPALSIYQRMIDKAHMRLSKGKKAKTRAKGWVNLAEAVGTALGIPGSQQFGKIGEELIENT